MTHEATPAARTVDRQGVLRLIGILDHTSETDWRSPYLAAIALMKYDPTNGYAQLGLDFATLLVKERNPVVYEAVLENHRD